MAWRRRTFARATAAQIAATTYGLGEPIVNKDAGAEKGRLAIGDGATAGGKRVAFKSELDAVASDLALHDHVPGDITGLDEHMQDLVAAMLEAGANITLTYNDTTGKLQIAAAGGAAATQIGALVNVGLSASVASNALTITLVSADGSALSGANKATIPFRSATAGSGAAVPVDVSSPLSLVISSGSTMGFATSTGGRLWVIAFNDGGTIRLGAINCRSGHNIFPLGRFPILSATAEGGVGAADSAHVVYAGVAITDKPYTVLGYLEWTSGLGTIGAWSAAPDRVQAQAISDKLPGDVVQLRHVHKTDEFSSNTAGALTDITGLSLSITPTSAANLMRVTSRIVGQPGALGDLILFALIRGSTNISGADIVGSRTPALGSFLRTSDGRSLSTVHATLFDLPNTLSATTYKVQFFYQGGGTSFVVNRTFTNTNEAAEPRPTSNIILEEVVA